MACTIISPDAWVSFWQKDLPQKVGLLCPRYLYALTSRTLFIFLESHWVLKEQNIMPAPLQVLSHMPAWPHAVGT